MKNNVVAIRHRQKDGNADCLVTPEMRRQIRELKRELDQYDNRLAVKGSSKTKSTERGRIPRIQQLTSRRNNRGK